MGGYRTCAERCGNQQNFFDKYYDSLVKKLTDKNGVLHDRKYTEYSRAVLAVTAIGKNADNVSGYNLITPLCDFDNTVWQGINGAIWALIALDSGNYAVGNTEIREKYIEKIISEQNSDGGWSLGETDASDTDLTAMALTSLAKYKNDEKISTAVNSALDFLSNSQNENGGFSTYGTETSESVSQVIIALCALKIPQNDARFVKNSKTPVRQSYDVLRRQRRFLSRRGQKRFKSNGVGTGFLRAGVA